MDILTFQALNSVNVNEHTERKKTDGTELTYLSWAWAWAEVKKRYENISYEVKKFDGLPYVYDDKTGYMVYTSVTINGVTHEMWLPVMDGANRAMKAEPYEIQFSNGRKVKVKAATMTDINKTIMRCLTKNLAMFGLGLYIYAGEDIPEAEEPAEAVRSKPKPKAEPEPAYITAVVPKPQPADQSVTGKITDEQKFAITKLIGMKGIHMEQIQELIFSLFGRNVPLPDLSVTEASELITKLNKTQKNH